MLPPSTRILIVDDMKTLRDLLRAYLRRLGYHSVLEAADGAEALDLLWKGHNAETPIDLVISDWNMPNMTGLDLLRRTRMVPDWKELPFIILTTESERDKVMEAVKAGANNYLVKPIEEDMLREKLQKIWEKKNAK